MTLASDMCISVAGYTDGADNDREGSRTESQPFLEHRTYCNGSCTEEVDCRNVASSPKSLRCPSDAEAVPSSYQLTPNLPWDEMYW